MTSLYGKPYIRLIKYVCVGVMTFLFVILIYLSTLPNRRDNCFDYKTAIGKDTTFLQDVLLSEKKPSLGKSIFFHETSCSQSGAAQLTARQACAVESAALSNPNHEVYVIFTSSIFPKNNLQKEIFSTILSYPNVFLRSLNIWTYASDTPIYDWLREGKIFDSKYVNSHISDFLRYLTLYKWGGIYLDLDVVVQQNFENVTPNYAGAESTTHVAAGVMNFDYKNFGHDVAAACLRNFEQNFNGDNWGNNGPGVITRVLQAICKTKVPNLMTRERCKGFKVFPINTFYAVSWEMWRQFFEPAHTATVLNKTKNSILVHVWNRHSKQQAIGFGSTVAYAKLAEKYCPRIFQLCQLDFT